MPLIIGGCYVEERAGGFFWSITSGHLLHSLLNEMGNITVMASSCSVTENRHVVMRVRATQAVF